MFGDGQPRFFQGQFIFSNSWHDLLFSRILHHARLTPCLIPGLSRLLNVLLHFHAIFGLVVANSGNLSWLDGTTLYVVGSFAIGEVNNSILDLSLLEVDLVFMGRRRLLGVPLCLAGLL
jgi:hypothetical protein